MPGCITKQLIDIQSEEYEIQSLVEGLFFTASWGPGKEVWIQNVPVSRLANRIFIIQYSKSQEEGSMLGDNRKFVEMGIKFNNGGMG